MVAYIHACVYVWPFFVAPKACSPQVNEGGRHGAPTFGLHTTHLEHADHDVAATLDAIRRLVEARV
jgi:hypothetical protein